MEDASQERRAVALSPLDAGRVLRSRLCSCSLIALKAARNAGDMGYLTLMAVLLSEFTRAVSKIVYYRQAR